MNWERIKISVEVGWIRFRSIISLIFQIGGLLVALYGAYGIFTTGLDVRPAFSIMNRYNAIQAFTDAALGYIGIFALGIAIVLLSTRT